MAWQREGEFKQLLSTNIRHLTKEGLDKLVSIAMKDMQSVRTFGLSLLSDCKM